MVFSEDGNEWFQKHGFEARCDMGDIRLHMQIAEHVDIPAAQIEGAGQVDRGSWNLEGQVLCGNDAIPYYSSALRDERTSSGVLRCCAR